MTRMAARHLFIKCLFFYLRKRHVTTEGAGGGLFMVRFFTGAVLDNEWNVFICGLGLNVKMMFSMGGIFVLMRMLSR